MQAAFRVKACDAAPLFVGLPGEHTLVQAALAGQGKIYADAPLHPHCAVAAVGDFLFCGGVPGASARHLLRQAMGSYADWLIIANDAWLNVVRSMKAIQMKKRMAFRHDVQPEDAHLRSLLAAVPQGVSFQPIERAWYDRCLAAGWSRDFVSQFTREGYENFGVGVLLMADGQPVAGASSYVSYPGGIEIQVETRPECQGRGYATLAAAKLILTAHERGLIATWDAANPASGHIAEKLGYQPQGPYQVAVIDTADAPVAYRTADEQDVAGLAQDEVDVVFRRF